MHIVHISPTYFSPESVMGGGEKYIQYMCKALNRAGEKQGVRIKNSIISFGDKRQVLTLAKNIQLHIEPGKPWDRESLHADDLVSMFTDADVVVVHQCMTGFGLFVAAHARRSGKRVIGMDHGGDEDEIIHRSEAASYLFDFILVYSTFAARSLEHLTCETRLARGPIDETYYFPKTATRNINHVVALGRLLPHKGFDRIVRVLPQELSLTIVGTKTDEVYFERLTSLARGRQVRILEFADDAEIRQLLSTCGVFVHASTHIDYKGRYYAKPELLGLAPLEALACGTPAFVSDAGSLSELAVVEGCRCFRSDTELSDMLREVASGECVFPEPQRIHEDVVAKFGLLQFGEQVLDYLKKPR